MKKCVFAIVIVLALLLSACVGKPQPASETSPSLLPSASPSPTPSPSPSLLPTATPTPTPEQFEEDYPELLYNTTATFDPETNIQRTTLDPQGLDLIVYFEIPVFHAEGEGYRKINAFFEKLRDDFFTPGNESLTRAWAYRNGCAPMPYTFEYESSVIMRTQTEALVSVSIAWHWWMGGVSDTGSDSYTFEPQTGELLSLPELIQDSEEDAMKILWTAMEDSGMVDMDDTFTIDSLKERTLDEFEFYVADDAVYIAFDRYEASIGAAGSFDILLPVTLKSEYCSENK